jgi:NAD(P)-dependent dehydrogenase (short-subunit alcohol dehydrogenase family)
MQIVIDPAPAVAFIVGMTSRDIALTVNSTTFSGRTAIVTGGSRGIGHAAAAVLAAGGANVIITSRHQEAARAAAADVGNGVVGMGAHITDESAANECVNFAVEQFGACDILVNNAGTNPAFGAVLDQDYGRFAKTIDVNVWGPLLWTKLVWNASMRDHGGVVINTASLGGLAPSQHVGVYNASKAALIHLTRQLAVELSPRVRVNAVAPGVVRTKMAEAVWRDDEASVADRTLIGRIGEPPDVAQAIAFLASDAASWITGQTLVIDGGQLLGAAADPHKPVTSTHNC